MKDHKNLFLSLLNDLENSQKFTDCKFIFDGESIAAHKVILSSVSPVFEAMFYGGLKEKEEIAIVDIDVDVFRQLIRQVFN